MKTIVTAILVTTLLVQTSWGEVKINKKPKIQLAILLDTSGSMSGLIHQARTQLWKIVNLLTQAKKYGITPELEVGLYEYGQTPIPVEQGHLRMVAPLTMDLDLVSESMFGLKTNGGDEFAGQVIQSAVRELKWSESLDDFKTIFIAGNEPFTQGPVEFQYACPLALGEGIIVNTIHCGSETTGIIGKWDQGAKLGGGEFFNINQNYVPPKIPTPYDDEILELNKKLNDTYIPYGKHGQAAKKRQEEQDLSSGGNLIDRGRSKASDYYRNESWDLVDALKYGTVKLEEIKDEDLPEQMRGLSIDMKYLYVEKKKQLRKEINEKIVALYKKREAFIGKKLAEMGEKEESTLDKAIVAALKSQLERHGFELVK